MTEREVAVAVAWAYLGKPYVWGGDDPTGFDCSGLVILALQSCGRYPQHSDTTADGLRRLYPEIGRDQVGPGDLVFWLRGNGRAFHVGLVIDPPTLYIGAEGGGRWATDPAEALARNAFVKVRPIASRGTPEMRVFATPVYEDSLALEAGE